MKNISSYLFGFICLQLLIGCENPMVINTTVHEDGKLDLKFSIEVKDTLNEYPNIFGIKNDSDWAISFDTVDLQERKYHKVFSRTFESDADWNTELDRPIDSLFPNTFRIQKEFRWFYTYINYSQTIRPINRFKSLDYSNYLTQEDFDFIERLPPSGENVSVADSLYLEHLHHKIYETYVENSMLETELNFVRDYIRSNNLSKSWLDSLEMQKGSLDQAITGDNGNFYGSQGNSEVGYKIMKKLGIPIERKDVIDYYSANVGYQNYQRRLSFMSYFNDGEYLFTIDMPWEVSQSNADSLSGNTLIWKPLVTKFLFKDYTMHAETRKLNYWAVIVSVIVVLVTVGLFLRKR